MDLDAITLYPGHHPLLLDEVNRLNDRFNKKLEEVESRPFLSKVSKKPSWYEEMKLAFEANGIAWIEPSAGQADHDSTRKVTNE